MRVVLLSITTTFALALSALAQNAASEKVKPAREADSYLKILADHRAAIQRFRQAYQAAKTAEAKQKVAENPLKADAFAKRMLDFAVKSPGDNFAIDALSWVVMQQGGAQLRAIQTKAVEILIKDHIDDPKLGDTCSRLVYNTTDAAQQLMRSVFEKSPQRDTRGKACFGLAQLLKNTVDAISQFQVIDEKTRAMVERVYGPDYFAGLIAKDPKPLLAESEKLFEKVIAEYGDLKHYRGTYADAAKATLYEIRNLAIGKVAPEIEGEDVDGVKFKLSDYRGKVVVLDFWGNW